MACCGEKVNFKSKVAEATRKKVAKRRTKEMNDLKELTTRDGIPFFTLSDDSLTPIQLRAKNRAKRIKSRNERIQNSQNADRQKAQQAKIKNAS